MTKKIRLCVMTFIMLACLACLSVGLLACGSSEDTEDGVVAGTVQEDDNGSETDGDTDDEGKGDNVSAETEHVHSLTAVAKKDSSCTENGNTAYWYCEGCGKYFSDGDAASEIKREDTVAPATGHSLVGTDEISATCDTAGNIAYWTCTTCGKIFSDGSGENEITAAETVVAARHTLAKTSAKAGTCSADGNIAYWTCSVCGKVFSDEGETEITSQETVVPAGHKLSEVQPKEATCTEPGVSTGYWLCSVCGKAFSDETASAAVDAESYVIAAGHKLDVVSAVAATCETSGNIQYWKCSVCEKFFSDGDGTTEITENETIVSASHTLTDVTSNYVSHTGICSVCGSAVTEWHDFDESNGCTGCSYVFSSSDYGQMTFASLGDYYLVSGVGGPGVKVEELVIPASYMGRPVTGAQTYLGDTSTEAIYFGPNMTNVSMRNYSNCTNLKKIYFSNAEKVTWDQTGGPFTTLEEVWFGPSLVSISASAFKNCTLLITVTFSDALASIAAGCFEGCTSLTGVVIPSSVESIGAGAFSGVAGDIYVENSADGKGWDESWLEGFAGTVYYYSEDEPSDDTGNWWHYENGVPTPWAD